MLRKQGIPRLDFGTRNGRIVCWLDLCGQSGMQDVQVCINADTYGVGCPPHNGIAMHLQAEKVTKC